MAIATISQTIRYKRCGIGNDDAECFMYLNQNVNKIICLWKILG